MDVATVPKSGPEVRRPLGLALTARGRLDGNDAEELEHLAAKALADADLIERGSGCLTVPVPAALQQPLGNSNYRSPAILKTRIRDLAHVACWPLAAATIGTVAAAFGVIVLQNTD